MQVNLSIKNDAKFKAFLEEFATIDYDAAVVELQEQFLADDKANKFVLAVDNAKDGQEHIITYAGISMDYDAQGTQIGGGKAYLDTGQEIDHKDITIIFM